MQTKNWYAWIDKMPPRPYRFHVYGEVLAPTPCYVARLCESRSHSTIPGVLLLELHLIEQPGPCSDVLTWIQARYDKVLVPGGIEHTHVEIFYNKAIIAQIKVETVCLQEIKSGT